MEFVLKKELSLDKQANRACAVLFSVIFLTLGAFVRVPLPFTPVPVTLQTFFVLLSAGLLGRRLGVIAQSSYLLLGVLGLPVFSQAASGAAYLISPTAGYLLGFILATFLISAALKRRSAGLAWALLVFCAGDMAILLTGSIWLKASLGVTFAQAFLMGFMPFVFGDILKAVAASFVYLRLKNRMEEIL